MFLLHDISKWGWKKREPSNHCWVKRKRAFLPPTLFCLQQKLKMSALHTCNSRKNSIFLSSCGCSFEFANKKLARRDCVERLLHHTVRDIANQLTMAPFFHRSSLHSFHIADEDSSPPGEKHAWTFHL